ncbi:hypothetical protein C9374_005141 [Naegleria lovaniensis]|uniref:RGS domain-containing protein n=1 Tax=Naegleria lovaniensis TaxID=51637 RepID=A0AA88GKC5_NAELO|nr:uncharacterized protein C9374_005141 [Naegleria lovaniensis]KAG2382561.1 hypothetical protein C9374_005141 [Naegleria lovaniensis]
MKKSSSKGSSSNESASHAHRKSPKSDNSTSSIGNKLAAESQSQKYNFKAPFIEEFLEQLQDEKKSKTTTPKSSTKDFLTMLLKQQEKRMKKQEEDERVSERKNSLSNMEYLVKKQQYLQKLRKKVLPNANFTPFVFNTLQFFEDNISYFTEHSIEFQRLIAQLRTREERQIFLHSVFMYYYADILLEMRNLQNAQQHESKYHTYYGMASNDDLYRRYFESTKITQSNPIAQLTTKKLLSSLCLSTQSLLEIVWQSLNKDLRTARNFMI